MVPLSAREPPPVFKRRLSVLLAIAMAGFATLCVRLWVLQVSRGEIMRTRSDENRIRLYRVRASRGTLRDRFGRVIVDNRPSFDAVLVPEDAPDLEATVENLSRYLRQSPAETEKLLHAAAGRPKFQEVILRRDLSWEEVVAIETHRLDLPGVSLRAAPRRNYPFASTLAHAVGYVGEVNAGEVKRGVYHLGDLIGRTGLERRWEGYLRGIDGGEQVEVDARGRKLRVLRRVEPVPGDVLTLTIDLELQRVAEDALAGNEGALVALDPRNGEILALVSSPAYNPDLFARGIRPDEWRALRTDPGKPLHDRAVRGLYPPASVFKIVVAAAALEEGVISPFTRTRCGGGLQVGNHFFHCWKRAGHGSVDLYEALVQSCDVYFYHLGQRLGIDTIAKWARRFGFGAPTGIGIEHEKAGLVPDQGWKRRRFGQPWYPGDTVSAVIGQGYLSVTPMQMASMIGAVATGERFRPHLVRSIATPEGEVVQVQKPERIGVLPLKKSTLALLHAALRGVVASEHGTAGRARIPEIAVAGKTGTAQVVRRRRWGGPRALLPRRYRNHAWFVAYAPAEAPEIAVACVVEHAQGGGGAVAAPITRNVLHAYFRLWPGREGVRYADVRPETAHSF